MKKTLLIIAVCLPVLVFSQTIPEYKAIVDSQKVESLTKIGEQWNLIYTDTTSFQKYYGDSVWFESVTFAPSLIDSFIIQNKWIDGNITFCPVRNGNSFRVEYLYSGKVKYSQLIERYETTRVFKNDGKALDKWLRRAKKDKVKKKDIIEIGNYILGRQSK